MFAQSDTSVTSKSHGHHLRYRSDIDGLRAVAVLPVILFHLGSPIFTGGFIGVDVFFVISGFLITTAIRREIESDIFSLVKFYERRARRILPALFATMLATTVVGLTILTPDHLRDLGFSLAGAAASISNILFWQQTDYFAEAVSLKPLIHTWSLGVEEQFYVLFPLLLIGMDRYTRRAATWPTIGFAGLSFALSLALIRIDGSANYYLLPSRAWELLVGSIVAFDVLPHIRHKAKETIAAIGLAMVCLSAVLLTGDSVFPAYNALWPCIGAGAVIYANSGGPTVVGRLLGWLPLVKIGLFSYSLYLVHWPIIVFTGYVLMRSPSFYEQLGMLSAMLALAWLSWRFIERPFRNKTFISRKSVALFSVAGIIVFLAAGTALVLTKGLPSRFPKIVSQEVTLPPNCFINAGFADWAGDACYLAKGREPPVLLWGDSHANHYRIGISGLSPKLTRSVLFFGSPACLPLLGVASIGRERCVENNQHALQIIKQYNIKTVILSGYWWHLVKKNHLSPNDIAAAVERLRSTGVRVKIIGDSPDFSVANPAYLAIRLKDRINPNRPYYLEARNDGNINATLERLVKKGDFFNPYASLCHGSMCLAYRDGNNMMRDTHHFTRFGSNLMARRMRDFFELD